ncbi:DUF1269 domain-containing protein [Patescibacteria group bacterium]|nr:DUF1269 domain-containing protein [Patescibacteria group bacterium]
METTTIGVFPNRARAEQAIVELRDSGIADADLSCVYTDKDGEIVNGSTGDKVGAGTMKGATAGAVVGTIAGLIVANGILPGIGTLFVAGPLATALGFTGAAATTVAGAATGAVAGGLLGGLSSLGVAKEDAELYESHVQRGDVLVISRSSSIDALDIFRKNNAMEVRQYSR